MYSVCFNGDFLPAGQPLFDATNRGFRYGDGLFETARFYKGNLLLADRHFNRLLSGLRLLQIAFTYTPSQLQHLIAELCEKNNCSHFARVRLAVYRDANNKGSFVIEAASLLQEKWDWNERGWSVVLYRFARKSCDAFANLKTANYLPYVMAGRYALERGADESLVLNMHNHICDGSKTNLFYMRGADVFTPALAEGCVAGVMRETVIDFLKQSGYAVHQQIATEADVLESDHIFLTNAIEGLRWVQQIEGREKKHGVLKKLHAALHEFILPH